MITILNFLITAFLSFLTVSLFPHFRIFGAVPLLPLFFIIQMAYYRKGFEPMLLAALAGLYFDLNSASPFGLYLMLFLLTAGLVRYFFEEGLRNFSFWHYMLAAGLSVTIYYASQLFFVPRSALTPVIPVLIPILIFITVNALFAALMYLFGNWYFEWLLTFEDYLKRR